MKFCAKFLPLLIMIVFSSTIIFAFLVPFSTIRSESVNNSVVTKNQGRNIVDLESDQSFCSAAGSTIEYNIYIENKRKSVVNCTLTALSNQGYYVEVWRDMDQIGSGDMQLIPPQESILTMSAGEVVTLIVKVTVPSDAVDGTVDNVVIKAVNADSGASDFVAIATTVNSGLLYPSNWIQLGSDPTFPTPPPERIDVKAFYYANNGTHVFFRMAEVNRPDTTAFRYSIYLDTKAGGQQIDSYNYDYLLSSDSILYEWNGTNWISSGYPTYWQVDGTSIVLWGDLDILSGDNQEIHVLACTTTKDGTFKDKMGAYIILKNNISELPLILIPILGFSLWFTISRVTGKNMHTQEHILRTQWQSLPTSNYCCCQRCPIWIGP
jgi:hypothetical protein